MKCCFLILLALALFSTLGFANHITGGEMYYRLVNKSANYYTYHFTLKLYRDCFAPPRSAPLDPFVSIGIFDANSRVPIKSYNNVPQSKFVVLNLDSPNPCISNPPNVCYEVGYYEFIDSLPPSANGYIVAFQRCCRIAGVNNLNNSQALGATYAAVIPGTFPVANGPENNSASFLANDTVIVCSNDPFEYSFAAEDADDADNLVYSFCTAFSGGSTSAPSPSPPLGPPYFGVPYGMGYSENSPLGSDVTINPNTGLIKGIAPAPGIYVVTVCVQEIRNGFVIATQRKDLQIKVGNCNAAKAALHPEYISCDGFTNTFINNSSSPLIRTYFWDFGDSNTIVSDSVASLQMPTHTYLDTGYYTLKLVTNRGELCSDSATAIVKVFPGFNVGFITQGACYLNPIRFIDTTTTVYGLVDTWRWEFGDATTQADTSHLQNATWTYLNPGNKTVNFIVTNSKGCIDTVSRPVVIIGKPPIELAFRDTLICVLDDLTLHATGNGIFNWTPNAAVINPNSPNPTVDPPVTTTYTVSLNLDGCVNTDSVRVRVINEVTLNVMPDTTICLTDDFRLRIVSDGLRYAWTPAAFVNNPSLQNPIAIAGSTQTYHVIARVGSCVDEKSIRATAVPYPVPNAGQDLTLCYNVPEHLNGSHNGIRFEWLPKNYLSNPNILNPLVNPPTSTSYTLLSYDTIGCPKAGRDTVLVNVLPKIFPFAGNDTAVVIGQPLQFNASGGETYQWSPSIGLNNSNIGNPIGIYTASMGDSILYNVLVFSGEDCVDSAAVKVKIFQTFPSIFVPTAFTPNGDGLNDIIAPIAVGIKEIKTFSIFNRWGQMVFRTITNGRGWDGRINGVTQGSNVYVWVVSAVDYLNKPYLQRGTVTLIQ